MGKTRKAKPKFKHSVNRRRVNKRNKKVGHFSSLGTIVKSAWKDNKTVRKNMRNMGLSFDPNETLKIPKAKEIYSKLLSENSEQPNDEPKPTGSTHQTDNSKTRVVEELEKFANLPREKRFELPQGQVQFLTYLLDKYGEDYKAMVQDRKNIYQETWKQLRAKVKIFKKIPHQWEAYLRHREELESAAES